jgi:release factor glutamine methyltransferase
MPVLVSQMLAAVAKQLKETGIPGPVLDAELLVAHVLNTDRYRLHAADDRNLAEKEIRHINRIAKRRQQFEPVAYILGKKEFYSLDFIVNRDVLIPRPETELLVDMAIYYARQSATVVDIGTGSGAIAVSVKYARRDLDVHATDISAKALKTARKNAVRIVGKNMIRFYQGNLYDPLSGRRFQVITINPPYVDKKNAGSLQKDLSYEPEVALFSGRRGRETIERVIAKSGRYLADDGVLIMEIGDDMKDFVKKTGKSRGFNVSVLNDYSGLPRVAVMKK